MTRLKPLASLLTAALLAGASPLLHAADTNDKAARYYEDALARYEKKDIAGAIIQLKNALQVNKAMLPVQALLGKALLANSDPVGAEVAFNEALRLGVSKAEVIVPLAEALLAQGKHNQLVESQQFEASSLPREIQQRLLLIKAQAWGDLGQSARALQALDEARRLTPQAAEVWLAEVPQRIRTRQFKEANAALEQAAKLGDQGSLFFFQRASLLHVQAKLTDALAAYDKVLQLTPDHTEAAVARLGILLDLNRDKDAQRDLQMLLTRVPDEPRAIYVQALLAERANDMVAARKALTQITALMDPVPLEFIRYRPQFLLLSGMSHFGLGNMIKAKPYLEAALRVQGPSPIAKVLARVYLEDKAPDKAVEVLESYLRTAPGDGGALTLLASIQTAQGRHAKATNLMREALASKDNPAFRTVLGLSLLRGGKTDEAVQSLEQAYKKDPGQAYAGSALVTLYLRGGQVAKAVTAADSLARRFPKNASVLVLQGTALTQAGDRKQARRAFEAALKNAPGLVQAELGLARLDIADRAFQAAGTRLEALNRANDRDVNVLMELANLAEAQNKRSELERWLTKADDASELSELRPRLAMVHNQIQKRDYPQALEASKKLLSKAPEDAQVLTLHGRVQLLNGDLVGARSTLSAASRRAAVVVPTLLAIAELQLEAKDVAGANYSVEKILSVEPNLVRAQSLMTGVEIMQGELGKAERRALQLTQTQPKLAAGHHLLADIALANRKPAAALDSLRRAHQLEPTNLSLLRLFSLQQSLEGLRPASQTVEAWLKQHPRDSLVLKALGDAQARNKAFEAASKTYERALQVNPNDAEALNSQASVLLAQRNTRSIALAQRAVQLDPGNSLYLDTLGWSEFQLGQAERALPLLRDARLRNPGNAEIRTHLAEVLIKLGRKAEARAELEPAADNKIDKESAARASALLQTLK